MYHNVQYLHFVSNPFAVPSVCSIVLLQCLIHVDGLCILLSVDVCVCHICKTRVRMFVKRNKPFFPPFVLVAFLNLNVCLVCVCVCLHHVSCV